jgi:hypothetical protein
MSDFSTEMQGKEFTIALGGRGHEVAADTLLTTLFTTTNLIQEINKDLSPDKKIVIKIKALQEGSFEIVYQLKELVDQASAAGLFTPENVGYLANIFGIFVGIVELRKFLKGEEPKSVQTLEAGVQVENVNGDVTIFDQKVINIGLNNQAVSDLISKQFEKMNSDDSVNSFTIRDSEDKPVFNSDRNDFSYLQNKHVVSKDSVREIIRNDARLKIVKLVWVDGNKWAFVFEGNKISAMIKDPTFFEKIDAGEQFAKGDELIVDLKIYQVFDPSIEGYLNQDYEITSVKEHIPRGEQKSLLS